MKKHQIFNELLKLNGKDLLPKYISKGSTVTKEGLLAITPNADNSFLKQDVLRALLRSQRIPEERDFFSTGSTVTKDALLAIYNSFISNRIVS